MVGQRALSLSLTLALIATLMVPAASAWQLPRPYESETSAAEPASAWTMWMSPGLHVKGGVASVAGSLQASVACAVGDLTGDGVADLVVQAQETASGAVTLQALAGPGFTQVVWRQVGAAGRVLACVPDIDLDGTADVVLQVAAEAQAAASTAGTTAQQSTQHAMQIVSGATGAVMMARTAVDTASGTAQAAGDAVVTAGSQATAALLPAAAGAAAFVQTEVTQGALPVPLPVPVPGVPIDSLTATAESSVKAAILDAQGQVSAVIEVAAPATQVLALAPVPMGGLPNVAVLTQQAISPAAEVAMHLSTLTLYNADGTLAWTTDLAATASGGLPILLPQAGDVNLDGIPDLIVNTVETGVGTVPAAGFSVLSGLDGSVLVTSGEAVSGLMAAVPLGTLPTGDVLLQVEAAVGASTMTISALAGTGDALWSITVDAAAQPLNAAIDGYTGDITGFTDLTGDAVADVGVLVHTEAGAALQVFDGITGAVAWNTTLQGVLDVVAVAQGTLKGGIASAGAGTTTDLLVVADTAAAAAESAGATAGAAASGAAAVATEPALTLLDGATGQVEWTVTTTSSAAGAVQVAVQAAGDLDADMVQDLLVTIVPVDALAAEAGAAAGVEGGAATAAASLIALSGRTGGTLYLNATGSGAPIASAAAVSLAQGPAYEGHAASVPEEAVATSPTPVVGLLAVLLVGLAAGLRRRRL